MDNTAFAASNPLFDFFDFIIPHLSLACFIFNAVITPLPMGLLYIIESFKRVSKVDLQIKLK